MLDLPTIDELVEESVRGRGIEPLAFVVTGSRAYGLHSAASDWDVVGVHISNDVLEHPRHRKIADVQEWKNLQAEEGIVSIVSYEGWKYIDLLTKGAFVAWEIEGLPEILIPQKYEEFWDVLKFGHGAGRVTSSFVYSAIGNAKSDMFAEQLNRKKIMMGYFRLCQAGIALIDGSVSHDKSVINKFHIVCKPIPLGCELLQLYLDPDIRTEPIDEIIEDHARKEVQSIIPWLENKLKTGPHTTLDGDRLRQLLDGLKKDRIGLIKEMK
jgi:hypothetical protein